MDEWIKFLLVIVGLPSLVIIVAWLNSDSREEARRAAIGILIVAAIITAVVLFLNVVK